MPSEVSSASTIRNGTKTKKSSRGKKNWMKWALAYSAVRMHNSRHSNRLNLYDIHATGDAVKTGFVVPQVEKDLESPCDEAHLQHGSDDIIFYGINSKAECLLVRVTRCPDQVAEAWLYLKLANGKTYQLVETSGYQIPFEGQCTSFSCGNLQMHYLFPMRSWRIFYCGMLKEVTEGEKEELVFVKFVLLWKANSDVYDLAPNTNPKGFTDAVARAEWESSLSPPLDKLSNTVNFYVQSGTTSGTITVDNGSDYEVYLFGEKIRNIGKTANYDGTKFTDIVGNLPMHGVSFHMGRGTIPGIFNDLDYGFVVSPEGNMIALEEMVLNVGKDNSKKSGKEVMADLTAGRAYKFQGSTVGDPIVFTNGRGWTGSVEVNFIEFTESDRKGYGLIMSGENLKRTGPGAKATAKSTLPTSVPLTVKFSDEISHFGSISGGKGSSLGKLTALSIIEKSFTVPNGIVVTTSAYSEFLTTEIKAAIKKMEDVVYGNVEGDPKEACSMVSSVVEKEILPSNVCDSIFKDLKELFGANLNKNKFAVRSSATGEDTAAMSAAGQMDTFLGVQGIEEIYTAVKKCWASQFGFIAVEYKRRNGQTLNSPMAVVIQEMVASEVSGVLFTCDPVTNNPSFITITANYGLGESVVSGSVDPDTIMLKRHPNGKLEIDSVVVGSKLQKIVMKASGGTVTEDIPEGSRLESCLTREMSERLGILALKIESYYKSARDIEWGISNNSIFMLQSRPVTNIAAETEYEMKHEFDGAMRCEIEYFTKANVGEILPSATSPLGGDMVAKHLRLVMKKHALRMGFADNAMQSMYFLTAMIPFCNHWMATIELITRCGFDTPIGKGLMISLFGRTLDDPDLLSYVQEKLAACTAAALKPSLTTALQHYKMMYFQNAGQEENKRRCFNYHCNFLQHGKAEDTFKALLESCSDFDDAGVHHFGNSEVSSNWNMNLFQILSDAHGAFDTDVYSDFAKLLATSTEVESANVPQALQEVANQIAKDMDAAKFKSMPLEEAVKWLESATSPSGDKFRQFLKRHGHRCLKEGDIYSMTWQMDPKSLVKMLQGLVGTGGDDEKKAEEVDFEKLVAGLNVRLGTIHKLKLKHALPHCRNGIRNREIGKSCVIKCFDDWRHGFRRLAKQMVAEGRLPEEDLLFFMQLDEIKHLLETRSPGIISRANYRKKLFPTVDAYIFPEISRGLPKPINAETDSAEDYEYIADLTMKGTPVSQGVTKGYCRVAMTVDEASSLKKGEILITYSTDIGWSPYFPIVSGVVTELGGLISHGAVISRELGLPCVVGLQGATKKFQTGDYVMLDGKKGILQRLPKPEE